MCKRCCFPIKTLFIAYVLTLVGCASVTPATHNGFLPKKVFPLPETHTVEGKKTFIELENEMMELTNFIGGYPPKFTSEKQRDEIYSRWLDTVFYAKDMGGDTLLLDKYSLLAELYRQGHNMDVSGSPQLADEAIKACFSLQNDYLPCHRTAAMLYLDISKFDKAEQSLSILSTSSVSEYQELSAGGFVFFYLYKRDVPKAIDHIDSYLIEYPYTARANMFKQIRANLVNGSYEYISNQ